MGRDLQLSSTRAVNVPPTTAAAPQSVAVAQGTATVGGTGRQKRVKCRHHGGVGAFVYLSFGSHDLDQRQVAGTPPANAYELAGGEETEVILAPGQKLFAITTAGANIRLSVHEYDDLNDVAVVE